MASVVELDGVGREFSGTTAVRDVNLRVERGDFVALLGPSGCGKTTTLRMIAGYLEPSAGRILIEGKDATRLAPERRNIGMVFQSYALFPHLSVEKNVAFGLEMRKLPSAEIRQRTGEALDMVGLGHLAKRRPAKLSGGQQQRVALARAIAVRPSVLLLDEPLSNLDARLRIQMRQELLRVQRETGITAILVTHDQEEALELADSMVILDQGEVVQQGPPREVFAGPKTRFVAEFLGYENFLTLDGHGQVTVRPEHIEVLPDGAPVPDGGETVTGTITSVRFRGTDSMLTASVDGSAANGPESIVQATTTDAGLSAGQEIRLFVPLRNAIPL